MGAAEPVAFVMEARGVPEDAPEALVLGVAASVVRGETVATSDTVGAPVAEGKGEDVGDSVVVVDREAVLEGWGETLRSPVRVGDTEAQAEALVTPVEDTDSVPMGEGEAVPEARGLRDELDEAREEAEGS